MKWYTCGHALRLEVSGADLATAVRGARHAFLNDFQILGGWLQLGRLGTAVEYLDRVRSRITRESALAALSHPDLEAALILSRVRAEAEGLSFVATVLGAPAPEYQVAATRDCRGVGERLPRAFPMAVLVILSGLVSRAARAGFTEVEVVVAPNEGRLEIALRLPAAARDLVGMEDEVLNSGGFTPAGSERMGVVGLVWRGARPAHVPLPSVAEAGAAGLELVIVPGKEPGGGERSHLERLEPAE